MSKGYTYTGTLSDGTTVSRYSAGHGAPLYTHAVDKRGANVTGGASFHGSLANASREAGIHHGYVTSHATRNGRPVPPMPQIVALVAIPGKAKRAA